MFLVFWYVFFIHFVLPENSMKPFVAICSGLWIYFQYFDHTVTEISSSLKKITYLWHTWVATAIFDKNHEQHRHSTFLLWNTSHKSNFPLGGTWVELSLYLNKKITQLTRYFVCYLYSYYLKIKRNHLSVIKKYTILQWFIYPKARN